jgi:hypothetical protein
MDRQGENMTVVQLILEDGNGKKIRLSEKKILGLMDKIVRVVNRPSRKERIVVYFSYQHVADA